MSAIRKSTTFPFYPVSRVMAVMIIPCYCFFTRPHLLPSTPPNLIISGKLHLPGKFTPLFGDASILSFGLKPKLLGGERLCLNPASEGCSRIFRSSFICDKFIEPLSAHQGKIQFRSLAMAFLVTNAMIWTIPIDALAKTCEADNSFFNMPLLLFVSLIGATVGGLLARQRKGELKRLNEQLRQINAALRRQAKIESYAPTLSYAPSGIRVPESEAVVDQRKEELIYRLKNGKNFLRNQDPEKAFVEFNAALELAQKLKDPIEEKKAARGLGASLQRQGKFREAIKRHSTVLGISEREGEDSGNTEAYGAIADCYTELGDLEKAALFYDKYISRLEKD